MKINKFFIAAVLGFCLLGSATSASAARRAKRENTENTEKSSVKRGQSKTTLDKGKTTLDDSGKTTPEKKGKNRHHSGKSKTKVTR